MSLEDALAYIISQKGQIFDPELLDVFINHNDEIINSNVFFMESEDPK